MALAERSLVVILSPGGLEALEAELLARGVRTVRAANVRETISLCGDTTALGPLVVAPADSPPWELLQANHAARLVLLGKAVPSPPPDPTRVTLVEPAQAASHIEALSLDPRQLPDPSLISALLDFSPDIIFMKDRDLRFRLVNPQALRVFGVSEPTEMLGKRVSDLLPEELATPLEHADNLVLQGQTITVDQLFVFGGRRHTLLTRKSPWYAANGSVAGIIGIGRDVTEDRLSQQRQTARYIVTQILADANSMDDAAEELVRAICGSVECAFGVVWSVHEDVLQCSATWAESPDLSPIADLCRNEPVVRGKGLTGRVWSTGEVQCRAPIPDDAEPHLKAGAASGLGAVYAFPVLQGKTVFGVIELINRAVREPDDDMLLLLAGLSNQVAQFANRRLAERRRQITDVRMQALVEACGRLLATLDTHSVMVSLADLSTRLIRADAYAIWRKDGESNTWRIRLSSGLSESYVAGAVEARDSSVGVEDLPAAFAVEDVQNEVKLESRRAGYEREGIRSLLLAPMYIGWHPATIVFYFRRPHRFDEADKRSLVALASLAGAALHIAEQYEEQSRLRLAAEHEVGERRQMEALLAAEKQALEQVAQGAPLGEALEVLIGVVERQSPDMVAAIFLLDDSGRQLRLGAAPHLPATYIAAIDGVPIDASAGWCARAAHERQIVVVPEVEAYPSLETRELGLKHGFHACWVSPIIGSRGELLGTMGVYYHHHREPSPSDLSLFQRAVHVARIAIEHHRAARDLMAERTLLQAVLEQLPVGVYISEADGRLILRNRWMTRVWAQDANQIVYHPDGRPYPPEELPLWRALRYGEAVQQEEVLADRDDGRRGTFSISANTVLDSDGQVAAGVAIISDVTEQRWQQLSQRVLTEVGGHLAQPIQDQVTMPRLIEALVPDLADLCEIHVVEEGERPPAMVPFLGVLQDLPCPEEMRQRLARMAPRSVLLVPLTGHDEVLGYVLLLTLESNRRLDERHLALLSEIARRIALALDNTRLYQRERSMLSHLAQSFLGEPPQMAGLEIHTIYQPAWMAARIGGDYYDFIRLGPRRLGVVIGDVCGKGVQAGTYTAMAKYMLSAYARQDATPTRVLQALNPALYESMKPGIFLTMMYGVLDLEAGTFTYVNAGHPAPYLLHNGSVQPLPVTAGVVGADPEWTFPQATLHVPEGASLVLYTDGITEAFGFQDEDPIPDILRSAGDFTAPQLADHVYQATVGASGVKLKDDVAIVVLKRGESGGSTRRSRDD
ncbi:MAG: SpoIIE family protein phosphatase [Candidatus Xenobia bacterium]